MRPPRRVTGLALLAALLLGGCIIEEHDYEPQSGTQPTIEVDTAVPLTILEGDTVELLVKLSKAPLEPITVTATADPESLLSISPDMLMFDGANWSMTQRVYVTGETDADSAIDEGVIALTSPGATAREVGVTVTDKDHPGFDIDTEQVDLLEGGTAIFQVRLLTAPRQDVEVTIGATDDSVHVEDDDATFTIPVGGFDVWHDIHVRADVDLDLDDGQSFFEVSSSTTGFHSSVPVVVDDLTYITRPGWPDPFPGDIDPVSMEIYVLQVDVPVDGTVVGLGILPTSTLDVQLGLYENSPVTIGGVIHDKPGMRLAMSAAVHIADSTGPSVLPVTPYPISAGRYWIAMQRQSTQGKVRFDNAGPQTRRCPVVPDEGQFEMPPNVGDFDLDTCQAHQPFNIWIEVASQQSSGKSGN